jgi:hypothetical protein
MTMRTSWVGPIIFWLAATAPAAEPGSIVGETWDAAYLNGAKAGYYHVTVREFHSEGQTLRRVTQELDLKLNRGGGTVGIHAETGDDETPDGKVVGVFVRHGLAKNLVLEITGKVDGSELHLSGFQQGQKFERTKRWDDSVISLTAEETLLKDRQAKPGDRITYRLYSPVVNSIVTTQVTVKDWERVPLNGVTRKLLRVESKPEKIENVQLPAQTLWFDEKYQLVRSQVEMPGLGEMTLVRTTKGDAMRPAGRLPDMMDVQAVALNRNIPGVHQQKKVVYRITLPKAEGDIDKMFAAGDRRQELRNVTGNSLELSVTAVRRPDPKGEEKKPPEEYIQSNFFITSNDKLVRKQAREAVGDEIDPWLKAQRIESWVKHNMKILNFENGIAPAFEVARTLEGDCTEYAMLAAAMCRAEGVPSRTAIGLVYHESGGPKLSYHMWTEVLVKGQWLALDATLGQGSVGPGHLKITDHSWHDTHSLTPLLPLMRVMMGKPKVEVLKIGD